MKAAARLKDGGMDEMEFAEADSNMHDLVSEQDSNRTRRQRTIGNLMRKWRC